MVNTKFEAYKLKRELKRSGIDYEFKRFKKNKFGEPSGETAWRQKPVPLFPLVIDEAAGRILFEIIDNVGIISGLYHEQNSNIQITSGETTQVRTKKIPMILCLYEDATCLFPGDIVMINNKIFKVTGVVNIQEWSIIGDVSLEVFDDGIHD